MKRAIIASAAALSALCVMATSTYNTFACGPVKLDLLSSPVNYSSYQVRSIDRKGDLSASTGVIHSSAITRSGMPR